MDEKVTGSNPKQRHHKPANPKLFKILRYVAKSLETMLKKNTFITIYMSGVGILYLSLAMCTVIL